MDISLQDITYRYGSLRALDSVSAEIPPGTIMSVLGPNGAGKTTLLCCMAGLLAPRKGSILYNNEPFNRGRMDLRKRFCFLRDFPIFFPNMTVLRHIGMILRLYGREEPGIEERVAETLADLDLLPLADNPLAKLSRGQAYKAALAALIVLDPEVWLVDEPFASGMDPQGIMVFKRSARHAAEKGHTIIYTTQILDVAEDFSDLVAIIDKGKLYRLDTIANLEAQAVSDGNVLEELFAKLRTESA